MAITNSIYRPFTNKTGLTLIEVLIALTILSIGLLGVAMMQVMSISGNTFSREMVVATELSQDILEKLSTFEYTETVEDPTLTDTTAGPPHTNGELSDANGNPQPNPIDVRGMATDLTGALVPFRLYTRTWAVTDDGLGFGTTNMKTIAVTVTWTDRTGDTHTVTLEGTKVRE